MSTEIYTFWISFNDIKNTDVGVEVIQRPNIPKPVKRVTHITVPGRDGSLTTTDDTYENIIIPIPMNYIVQDSEKFQEDTRTIKNWLDGNGVLRMSDDPEVFYKVKDVVLENDIERVLRRAGVFSAQFVCDPYTYFDNGTQELNISDCEQNQYKTSKPLYKLTGSGLVTLTVNGNSVTADVDNSFFIDTDLMITYDLNGGFQKANTRFDYSNFYLKPGSNTISVSGGGVKIRPNWRSL